MKKLLILLLLGFLVIPFVSSESIGVFKQSDNITLYQTCNNCSYINLTSVKFESTELLSNKEMTKTGTYYNYTLGSANTNAIGMYDYCYEGGNYDTGQIATGCLDFEVTSNGNEKATSGVIIMFSIAFLILLGAFGFLVLYSIPHVVSLDFDLRDMLISWTWFFVTLGVFALEQEYLGNVLIGDIMGMMLDITMWTNVIFASVAFLLSTIIGQLSGKAVRRKEKKRWHNEQ